jgi:hypothetical protein
VVVAVRTVATMAWVRVVLARGGLPAALRALHMEAVPAASDPPPPGAWDPGARHLARVVGRVLQLPLLRSTCLPTAMSLARVLNRHAVPADVVIGVSATQGFSAHAWVELGEGRIDLSAHPLDAHRAISRLRPTGNAR